MRSSSARVDYDAIAPLYDAQPYRGKTADPELARFLADRATGEPLTLLDIACGTGSQLVANLAPAPRARMIGLDGSLGMLRQARAKAADIAWVRCDAASLPLASEGVDFASCQFAFHHVRDKTRMLCEAFRVLRPGGRLVIRNLCPEECEDWLCYVYFPAARRRDRRDFWPLARLVAAMGKAGFTGVTAPLDHVRYDYDLRELLETSRRRDTNSQLLSVPDREYAAGLLRIERDIAEGGPALARADHLCFATVCGDKPPNPGRTT